MPGADDTQAQPLAAPVAPATLLRAAALDDADATAAVLGEQAATLFSLARPLAAAAAAQLGGRDDDVARSAPLVDLLLKVDRQAERLLRLRHDVARAAERKSEVFRF